MRVLPVVLLLLASACGPPAPVYAPPARVPEVATFSIVARDPETGDLGVAVQSRFFGVGAVVPYARADVGALATQALAEPTYGPDGLGLLDDGRSAAETLRALLASDPGQARRQIGLVDAQGGVAVHTGTQTMAWSGHVTGEGYCCQGNILAGAGVVKAMAAAFEQSQAPFPERLVASLQAGQAAGGDKRGRQSAALLIARRQGGYRGRNDRWIDVRVDDHPTPIAELARLLALRRRSLPQAPRPRLIEGLVREAVPQDGELQDSARAAWMRSLPPTGGPVTYVGSVLAGNRATVHYVDRASPGLLSMRFERETADTPWRKTQ